jgi:hypothetical protein
MKIAAAVILVVAIAIVGAWEALWRFDHFPAESVVISASGSYVAQERTLPEGSIRPLRSRHLCPAPF